MKLKMKLKKWIFSKQIDSPLDSTQSIRVEKIISNRKFGLFLLILGIIGYFCFQFKILAMAFFAIVLFVLVIQPSRLEGPKKNWLLLGKLLAKITTPVFLSLLYYVIFTPLAMVLRVFGSFENFKKPKPGATVWRPRDSYCRSPSYFKNQF